MPFGRELVNKLWFNYSVEDYIIKYYRNKYCNETMSIIMLSNGKTNYVIAVITPQLYL